MLTARIGRLTYMSKTFKNIRIPYPTEGVIRTAQLNDTIAPENSVQLAVNMNFDRVGAMITRPGVTEYAPQRAGEINSFGTWNPLTGNARLLAQVNSSQIFAWDNVSWTLVRALSGGGIARYDQFLNLTWMVNGTSGDPVATYNGVTFGSTLVPVGFPKGHFIQAGFEGRVWVADRDTDVIYFTDIVQFTPPSTYTLTYDSTRNFIKNFSPQDGDSITGLWRVPRALLVFKRNHIYRIYGAYSVDSYPAYNVGTYSQESIVEAKDGLYFHHPSGFYKFNYDGQPTEISRKIIDFVRAVAAAGSVFVKGVYDGFDNIEWTAGNIITVDSVKYSNCVMRYTISTQTWTIYDYVGNLITAMVSYDEGVSGGPFLPIMGTFAGKVGVLGTGTTDFGQPIYFEMIDRWRSFTDMYAKSKAISGINVYTENAAGTRLEYQTEKTPPNVYEYIDTITDQYDALFPNANTIDFANIRLRLSGNTSGTPIVFHGIEILSIQDKGFEQN